MLAARSTSIAATASGKALTKTTERLLAIRLPTFSFGTPERCTYCGDPPSGVDHVIPVSYQHINDCGRLSANGPWTYACTTCNSKLGANFFDTFKERCEWLHGKLERAGAPVVWDAQDFARLDYNLQRLFKSNEYRRKWLRMRADWYGSRDFLLNIENLQWGLPSLNSGPACRFLLDYFGPTVAEIKALLYR